MSKGHIDQPVEQVAPGEAVAHQHPGDDRAEHGMDEHHDQADFDRQPEGCQYIGLVQSLQDGAQPILECTGNQGGNRRQDQGADIDQDDRDEDAPDPDRAPGDRLW